MQGVSDIKGILPGTVFYRVFQMVFYIAYIRGTFGILLLYSIYTEDIIWYSTRCMYRKVFDKVSYKLQGLQ